MFTIDKNHKSYDISNNIVVCTVIVNIVYNVVSLYSEINGGYDCIQYITLNSTIN